MTIVSITSPVARPHVGRWLVRASLFALWLASASAAPGAVIYREVFPNHTGSDMLLSTSGWQAHHSAAATPLTATNQATVALANGSPTNVAAINSFPASGEQTRGYFANVATAANGTPNFHWTTEYTTPNTFLWDMQIRWRQGNASASDVFRAAVQVDNAWYASDDTFTNPAGITGASFSTQAVDRAMTVPGGDWRALAFTPGATLALGGAAALPSGNITGFGLYNDNKSATLRFDTFEIHATPNTTGPKTIGHWRFEGDSAGFVSDSSGHDLTLTSQGTTAQVGLPMSGPGSAFPNPTPQTAQANVSAANLGNRAGHLNTAYDTLLAAPSFTFEAFAHLDSGVSGGRTFLASQWNAAGNQRAWGLGVASTTGQGQAMGSGLLSRELFLVLAPNGTPTGLSDVLSGFQLFAGVDYFIAAAYQRPDSINPGYVTFWLQDLTNDGPLQTSTVLTSVESFLPTSGGFQIGTLNNDAAIRWAGVVGEARLSKTALTTGELLIMSAVPEPSTFTLLGFAGLLAGLRYRRRK